MVEKGIRCEIWHIVSWHIKENCKKYMKKYDENKYYSYTMYWDNFYIHGKRIAEKLPVDGFMSLDE